MKLSVNFQNVALPLVLGFGDIWVPKRLFVRGHETKNDLRQLKVALGVGGKAPMETDSKSKSGTSRTTGTDFPPNSKAVIGEKKKADLGILSKAKVASQRLLKATCNEFVECEDGFVVGSDRVQTCADACGGFCCEGIDACSGFTGNVCKNHSCMGTRACEDASIEFVVESCRGDQACQLAVVASEMNNSCNDWYACSGMASGGASIGNLTSSCNGKSSCVNAARFGYLGDLTESCNGPYACHYTAHRGYVGGIMYSCNENMSCRDVAIDAFYPDWMQNCCNEANECDQSVFYCDGVDACESAGLPDDCFGSPMMSSSLVPSASPAPSVSSVPSVSSFPSTTFSPTKSSAPSSSPTTVDQHILGKANDVKDDTKQIRSFVSVLDEKIDDITACNSIAADVKVVGEDAQGRTMILVFVTSGGTSIAVDNGTPQLFALNEDYDEVSLSPSGMTEVSPGIYLILFDKTHTIHWVKFFVEGAEHTVSF